MNPYVLAFNNDETFRKSSLTYRNLNKNKNWKLSEDGTQIYDTNAPELKYFTILISFKSESDARFYKQYLLKMYTSTGYKKGTVKV